MVAGSCGPQRVGWICSSLSLHELHQAALCKEMESSPILIIV